MWMSRFGKNFFLNGQEIYFFAMLVAAGLYTVFSLFGRRTHFNLDKMLHRGEYGIAGESIPVREKVSIIKTAFGVTEEFTKGDKIIYAIAISQSLVMFLLFVAMTAMAYFIGLTDKQWSLFHYYSFWIMMSASFVVIAWLSIGGIRDTISLFRDLRAAKRDTTDDGRVTK
jgi:SSS family solute:Na+ symporter